MWFVCVPCQAEPRNSKRVCCKPQPCSFCKDVPQDEAACDWPAALALEEKAGRRVVRVVSLKGLGEKAPPKDRASLLLTCWNIMSLMWFRFTRLLSEVADLRRGLVRIREVRV